MAKKKAPWYGKIAECPGCSTEMPADINVCPSCGLASSARDRWTRAVAEPIARHTSIDEDGKATTRVVRHNNGYNGVLNEFEMLVRLRK